MVIEQVRLLCYMFIIFFCGLKCAQRSTAFLSVLFYGPTKTLH